MARKKASSSASSAAQSGFGGGSSHTAFSDFAHLQAGMINFALSLGNDGSDIEELRRQHQAKVKKMLKNQQKAAAAAAAAATALKTNEDGEKEGPCPRADCTALRDSEELEERIFEERLMIEEKIEEKNGMLQQIQQRLEEGESEIKANAEQTKLLQSQIKEKQKHVKVLEEQRDGMEDVQKEIMNNIMHLQIKAQKAKTKSRLAQQALVDAMWGGDNSQSSGTNLMDGMRPLSPLLITKHGPPKNVSHTLKYTNLASGEAIDISEVISPLEMPAKQIKNNRQRPKTTGSLPNVNVWSNLTANLPMENSQTTMLSGDHDRHTGPNGQMSPGGVSRSPLNNRGARTASANPFSAKRMHNPVKSRKLMLMMKGSAKKKANRGKPTTAPSRSGVKKSVLAELKEEIRREKEAAGTAEKKLNGYEQPES